MTKDYDSQTLADLVVCVARTDTTQPDLENLRNGWMTDLLFSQMIDKFLIQQCNNPTILSAVAKKVLARVDSLPEAAVLASIAIFRAERLMSPTPAREKSILEMIKKLGSDIAALPDGPRKMRCQSLFQYHQGFFYDASGRFDLAAEMQLQSALEANRLGDKSGEAIGLFTNQLFELKDALRLGKTERIGAFYTYLEKWFDELVSTLVGTALETLWAQVNGPVFMIEACVWLDHWTHPKWHQWVETSLKGMEQLGSSWNLCADFVRAVDMDQKGDPEAVRALNSVADSNDANERRAAALLILVRHAIGEGQIEQAKKLISLMPEQGAQHVVAIAKRCIKQ